MQDKWKNEKQVKLRDNAALKRETHNDIEIEGESQRQMKRQRVKYAMERQCRQSDRKTEWQIDRR